MKKLSEAHIGFDIGKGKKKRRLEFAIVHDLPDPEQLQWALEPWLHRTTNVTDRSFAQYVSEKNPLNVVMTRADFEFAMDMVERVILGEPEGGAE